ncbi:hypothetical protein C8R44DRAFT_653781, partial [Mycena epipterygia]
FPNISSDITLWVLADNTTVVDLIVAINANCSPLLINTKSTVATPFDGATDIPHPEAVVQYYRANSVASGFEGYNDTAVLMPENNTVDAPLPGGIDTALLYCVNQTIGSAVPLIDAKL